MSTGKRHIVITGFMGAGKTTVAVALARLIGCDAVDLDQTLTQTEQRTPAELIEQDGEEKFRETETLLLTNLLDREGGFVLALGGGTWTVAANRKLLDQRAAFTVWLDAPFDLCWKRITSGDALRPLAPSYEAAQDLYDRRLPLYALAECHLPVDESETPEELAQRIARLII